MPCVHTSCYETKTCVAYSTVTPELVRKRHNKKQNILSDMMSRTKTDRALSVRVKFPRILWIKVLIFKQENDNQMAKIVKVLNAN